MLTVSGRGARSRLGLGEPIASVCAQCFGDMLHAGLGAPDRLGIYEGHLGPRQDLYLGVRLPFSQADRKAMASSQMSWLRRVTPAAEPCPELWDKDLSGHSRAWLQYSPLASGT